MIKAKKFRLMILFTLLGIGTTVIFAPLFSQEKLFIYPEMKDLRREIQILNLVNGLELTPFQMQLILDKAFQCQQLRQEARQIYLKYQKELDQLLVQIRQLKMENRDIPWQLEQHFHQLESKLKKAKLLVQEEMYLFAREIEKYLEPHQILALKNYQPCIIPPRSESRIGQVADIKGMAAKLSSLRAIPDGVYEQRKKEIVARTIDTIKFKTGQFLNEEVRADLTSKLSLFYDKVRTLNQIDFEAQKEKLANEFVAITKTKVPTQNTTEKIATFLLAPEIVTILESKLQMAKVEK